MQVEFETSVLDNGLKLIVHQDNTTPMVAVNILYDVGSKDENKEHTGFAHLFEHLMFSGSKNAPDFDAILEAVGGENNAFTNNDFTNYYISIPKPNLETALWLEADRMEALNISKKSLSVQKNVVIEEFKQRYLNQPYGDVSLLMKPLVYTQHPYSWSTIGKDISHIEKTTLDDVLNFFQSYYIPNNAILVLAGDIEVSEARSLAEKYFSHIPRGNRPLRNIPLEPEQTQERRLVVERDVPHNAIFKTYHICERMHPDFYAFDLLSDVLSNGKSSRFYIELVKNRRLFTDVNAFVSGDIEAGTFMVNGNLAADVRMEEAEAAIMEMIEEIKETPANEQELEKVKNKLEASLIFSNIKALDKAMNLAYFELMGGAALLNEEDTKYRCVDAEHIQRVAKNYLRAENCSTMYYYSEKNKIL